MGEALLKVAEAAEILRMSPSYLNKLRVTGGGPAAHFLGRSVRYSASDLEVWMAGRRRLSTSEPKL